jgi:hypothetical protein
MKMSVVTRKPILYNSIPRGLWIAVADDINVWEREGMYLALIKLFDYLNLRD